MEFESTGAMTPRCSRCSNNGHNSRTCPTRGGGGVKLFGVRLTDGSSIIKKSASMGNLSAHYHSSSSAAASPNPGSPSSDLLRDPVHVPDGYLSDDPAHASRSTNRRAERKKGVPWTEDEHRLFLLGLQKLGKGDWRGISRSYVTSRTPTQVASHAQKYFNRHTNAIRRKRRSSLFDIVPEMDTDQPPLPEGQFMLPPSQAFDTDTSNSFPSLKLSLSQEFEPMEATSEEKVEEEAKETVAPSGFQTPDKQNLSMPDPNSKGEEDSQHLQLQMHQYSDATFSIPDLGSNSGTAPEGGVLYMEESVRLNEMGEVATQGQKLSLEVSYSSEEELLEEMWLEELEETPSDDPGELEDLNCNPMDVPPTISHHFSILHVLDLSYTEINSLPQSISRLVALQKLFLRSCDLLHELPPEIGELLNLQVLDLEGTEILCLPKEIAKLVNLTCLKVSFYGYANKTVIPRRVLSNLSRLNELIIHVTPYGEWWDVEVEAIIDDLCSLDELRTLKLYLPTAELLEGLTRIFSRLAIFRFIVGRHEEHFISRLPRDVEEEFNNREKGLKYINGSRIPNEITKVLKHANAFFLQRHWAAKSLSEFGHENMNEVKFCLVMECNEFRTIIDSEQFYQGKDGRSESEDFMDIDENIVLVSLQKMIIRYMKNMASIWNGPIGKGSLSNMKSLALHTCPNLATVFTIDVLSNLINLEELIVEDCPKIDSLVSLKSSNSKSGLFLPNLKKISLLELPELVSISSGLWIAPKLEKMVIFYCPKLKKLSTMDVSSTNLKVINGEKEWWDALKWYESDLSTEHEDFLTSLFIPLRRNGDLMAQLTKD